MKASIVTRAARPGSTPTRIKERTARPYRPICDYALIGDCHGAALVAIDGSIDWCCLKRFDAVPVLWRMLDAGKGGFFQIAPVDATSIDRAYLPGTNILRTIFTARSGRVSLTDLMPVGRAPGVAVDDYVTLSAPGWLVRIVEGIEGRVPLRICHQPPSIPFDPCAAGGAHGTVIDTVLHAHPALVSKGDVDITIELDAGERRVFILTPAAQRDLPSAEVVDHLLRATGAFWQEWIGLCRYDGPYGDAVRRSALALKLLTFAPTGALVAAPTTSLPEQPGGERNWDYRCSWLRDSALTLHALAALGYSGEARRFCEYQRLCCVETLPGLQVLYGIGGETELPERTLDHIEGYLKSRPVRTGNAAYRQRQIDIYGEVLDWLFVYRQLGAPSDETQERMAHDIADYVVAHWQEPDQGLWEMRSEPRHHVHSKVMCWVALDRAMRLCGDARGWPEARSAILDDIRTRGVDPNGGHLVQAFGFSQTDAALLLIPSLGLPIGRENFTRTIEAVERELRVGDYVRRYLTHDGLAGSEGAFLICSFWLVDALLFGGRTEEARQLFERLLLKSNDVGLYAEEIDPATEAFLGNFPQAFTHLALVGSAVKLQLHEEGGEAALAGTHGERTRRAAQATSGVQAFSLGTERKLNANSSRSRPRHRSCQSPGLRIRTPGQRTTRDAHPWTINEAEQAMTYKYDLVVLGSGSTAFAAALTAQELGKTAVMTERRTHRRGRRQALVRREAPHRHGLASLHRERGHGGALRSGAGMGTGLWLPEAIQRHGALRGRSRDRRGDVADRRRDAYPRSRLQRAKPRLSDGHAHPGLHYPFALWPRDRRIGRSPLSIGSCGAQIDMTRARAEVKTNSGQQRRQPFAIGGRCSRSLEM